MTEKTEIGAVKLFLEQIRDDAYADDHRYTGDAAVAAIASIDALIEQRDQALKLLAMMYDKWENGDPCYQDADITCDSLGNAFKLTDEEEEAVLAALASSGERGK